MHKFKKCNQKWNKKKIIKLLKSKNRRNKLKNNKKKQLYQKLSNLNN